MSAEPSQDAQAVPSAVHRDADPGSMRSSTPTNATTTTTRMQTDSTTTTSCDLELLDDPDVFVGFIVHNAPKAGGLEQARLARAERQQQAGQGLVQTVYEEELSHWDANRYVAGVPVDVEHAGNAVGQVLAARTTRDGTMAIAVRISDPGTAARIRSGELRSFSLTHEYDARTGEAKPVGVAVCKEGARSGTGIMPQESVRYMLKFVTDKYPAIERHRNTGQTQFRDSLDWFDPSSCNADPGHKNRVVACSSETAPVSGLLLQPVVEMDAVSAQSTQFMQSLGVMSGGLQQGQVQQPQGQVQQPQAQAQAQTQPQAQPQAQAQPQEQPRAKEEKQQPQPEKVTVPADLDLKKFEENVRQDASLSEKEKATVIELVKKRVAEQTPNSTELLRTMISEFQSLKSQMAARLGAESRPGQAQQSGAQQSGTQEQQQDVPQQPQKWAIDFSNSLVSLLSSANPDLDSTEIAKTLTAVMQSQRDPSGRFSRPDADAMYQMGKLIAHIDRSTAAVKASSRATDQQLLQAAINRHAVQQRVTDAPNSRATPNPTAEEKRLVTASLDAAGGSIDDREAKRPRYSLMPTGLSYVPNNFDPDLYLSSGRSF